jgi:hypothetical protein
MLDVERMSPHVTREAVYHEALEAFIRTSAVYLELEDSMDSLQQPPRARVPADDTRGLS